MARLVQFGVIPHYLAATGGYYAAVPPQLDLSVVSTDFSEGALLTFRVTATRLWDEDITVTYATSDGTATAGVDYTAASGSATLPAGSLTTDIAVQTIDRTGVQSDRTFTLTLSNPLTTSLDVPTLGEASVEVTIDDTDVEAPVPGLVVSAVNAEEGSPLTFRVATSDFAPAPYALPFFYATADGTAVAGTDYAATSGDIALLTGESSRDITVTTIARSGYQASRTVQMTISHPSTAIVTGTATGFITDTEAPAGDHGYFESLVEGAYHWKSLSLRDQADINTWSQFSPNSEITYAPGADAHPHAQDAAKITMVAWNPDANATVYGADLTPTAMSVTLGKVDGSAPSENTAFNAKGAYIRIDDEIMQGLNATAVFDRTTGLYQFAERGVAGTTPATHSVGALVYRSGNSLRNQLRFDLDTEGGHIYFITWDAFFDDSHYDAGVGYWKWCQFSGAGGGTWLEPRVNFGPFETARPGWIEGTHIGEVDVRTYNLLGGNADYTLNPTNVQGGYLGPNATKDGQALSPQLSPFLIRKHCWTRWFFKLDQRANDYDLLSLWVADEVTEPVQLFDGLQISVRGIWDKSIPAYVAPESVHDWWIEWNTSTNYINGGREADFRDLISYMRNFAALVGVPSDVSPFLIKPTVSA